MKKEENFYLKRANEVIESVCSVGNFKEAFNEEEEGDPLAMGAAGEEGINSAAEQKKQAKRKRKNKLADQEGIEKQQQVYAEMINDLDKEISFFESQEDQLGKKLAVLET